MKTNANIADYCLVENTEYDEEALVEFDDEDDDDDEDENNNNTSNTNSHVMNKYHLRKRALSPHRLDALPRARSRVLQSDEDVYALTRSWLQMRTERKCGFKSARLVLTKRQATNSRANMESEASNGKKINIIRFLAASAGEAISPSSSSSAAAPSGLPADSMTLSSINTSERNERKSTETLTGALTCRIKSSVNRLVRQKSFDEGIGNGVIGKDADAVGEPYDEANDYGDGESYNYIAKNDTSIRVAMEKAAAAATPTAPTTSNSLLASPMANEEEPVNEQQQQSTQLDPCHVTTNSPSTVAVEPLTKSDQLEEEKPPQQQQQQQLAPLNVVAQTPRFKTTISALFKRHNKQPTARATEQKENEDI